MLLFIVHYSIVVVVEERLSLGMPCCVSGGHKLESHVHIAGGDYLGGDNSGGEEALVIISYSLLNYVLKNILEYRNLLENILLKFWTLEIALIGKILRFVDSPLASHSVLA